MPEARPSSPSPERMATTMRAMVHDRYGPPEEVVRPARIPVPDIAADEVLVRVEAAAINAYDWHMIGATPAFVRVAGLGFLRPKNPIPGRDLAGVVEQVGSAVTRFSPGDDVFGWNAGTAAEYVAAKERALVAKPKDLSMAEAAAVPLAAMTALQGVRDHGAVTGGSRVLVLGASGGVGQFAVQIAKSMGAHVTGVCGTHNVETVRSLGAHRVVDYANEDVYGLDDRFDVVLHVNGQYPIRRLASVMADDGVLVFIGADEGGAILGPARFLLRQVLAARRLTVRFAQFTATNSLEDLQTLADMLADGSLTVAVDHTAPLEDFGREVAYLRRGHATGKVVIEVQA